MSAYFCISDPKVCPVRAKFLGSHVPVNDSLSSLDEFVIRGVCTHSHACTVCRARCSSPFTMVPIAQIRQVGSTPYQIMQRSRTITRFMANFRRTGGVGVLDGGRAGEGCQAPSLLHSK